MKKILLAAAMILAMLAANTVFADEYETLVYENFESDNPSMFICDGTTQSNATAQYSAYGIGKALSIQTGRSTFHMTPFEQTVVKSANTSGAAIPDFKKNKPNLYLETEFDAIIKAQRQSADERIYLGYNNDPGQSVAELRFKRDGKIYLKAKSEKNGADAEKELGSFIVGEPMRIRIVMHITGSGTETSAEEITAVYLNGENALDKIYYLNTKFGYDSIFINHANYISLDNIGVYRYTSTDGKSPVVNKGHLVALLREKEEISEISEEYAAAAAVYENISAAQSEVDGAYAILKAAGNSKEIIQKEFTWDKITDQPINGVTESLALPTVFKSSLGSLDVAWQSSDVDFLTETGEVTRPRNDKNIVLTARLTSGQYSSIFSEISFNVTIKGDAENTALFTFGNLEFESSGGIAASVPRKGGRISGVKLLSRDICHANVAAAVYSADKTLYGIGMGTAVPAAADTAVTVRLNAALPQELTGCTVKVFVWKNETLVPVMRTYSYDAGEHIVNGAKIFIAGDSTAHTYAAASAPQTGWGQVFDKFTDSRTVSVLNYSLGGRGAESFYKESNYTNNIKNVMTSGDYLFIQFGHNDYKNGCSKEVYKEYMKKYISDARERGVIPVVLTSITRCVFKDGKINQYEQNMKIYTDAAKEVAAEENAACLDMFNKSVEYLESLGETDAMKLYLGTARGGYDVTHFNEYGAEIYAGFIRDLINESEHSTLDSLKDCLTDYSA